MAAAAPSAASEVHRLLRAGRLEEALVFAERSVAGAQVCLPGHGFLASVLLKLGRVEDAEQVVARAEALTPNLLIALHG